VTHRARSWLLPAPLAAAAVVVAGIAGFFLGFVAVLLWIDRLLDRLLGGGGTTRVEAERAFRRLSRRRREADLSYLAMESGPAAMASRRSLGVQTIAIASIVGTVDRHKAESFDQSFRPAQWSRGRWTLMYLAAQRGVEMPPISVYRFGGQHYVRDGHHRVSVARALGAAGVDAEVVELS
jgi:hypothetical protein